MLYYHQGQLGSTRLLTDASGAAAATFSYDPYGAVAARTGTATTPFGFAGQYTDAESGLIYLRARYYEPATGQFITRDPAVREMRQPYAYVNDSPPNGIDPAGLGDCPNGAAAGCPTGVNRHRGHQPPWDRHREPCLAMKAGCTESKEMLMSTPCISQASGSVPPS